ASGRIACNQRLELAGDFDAGVRTRHIGFSHNGLDRGESTSAFLRMDETQIDFSAGMRRNRVDGLAASDCTDVAADAVGQVREPMQPDDLAGEFLYGTDALREIVTRVGGLADDVDAHELAALASSDDAAPWTAGLAVEHRAGRAGRFLDQGLG